MHPSAPQRSAPTATARDTVSVIIPALNEARQIEATLASVVSQDGPLEILVVDGGSSDGTAELAAPHATVVRARRGRAWQMNAGAAHASGGILLFLHADTRLPEGALHAVREALARPGVSGGAFRLAFDATSPLLRLYSASTRLPLPRLCFGDRGLFTRRRTFDEIGGFPELPLFEDLEFVRLLQRQGTFCFLPQAVVTSARRFQRNGALRQQLRNGRLWLHYLAGTDPRRLVHLYGYGAERG